MDMKLRQKALAFATEAHKGQVRKYTGEPYIVHPIEVANIVDVQLHSDVAYIGALLHDVVEDCNVTHEEVKNLFGAEIAEVVYYVTDISQKSDGNRKVRKEIDRNHYASGNYTSQSIKVADLISNSKTIVPFDPGFARTYLTEKRKLLDSLTKANANLVIEARKLLIDSIVELESQGFYLKKD